MSKGTYKIRLKSDLSGSGWRSAELATSPACSDWAGIDEAWLKNVQEVITQAGVVCFLIADGVDLVVVPFGDVGALKVGTAPGPTGGAPKT